MSVAFKLCLEPIAENWEIYRLDCSAAVLTVRILFPHQGQPPSSLDLNAIEVTL